MIKYGFLFLGLLCFSNAALAQGSAARQASNIDQVQSMYNLSGKGVLTIMMDRGIDYRHPDFIDENGNTRIAYIFDLYDNTGANAPNNPFGVGTIYDSTAINAALQAGNASIDTDLFGHGTATTGIMAGNGSGALNPEEFRGVAYQSKIISIIVTKDFVPASEQNPGQPGQFNPALLPIGFQFASQKIKELAMPSVTLLNIGSVGDPTDGSISLCETIDAYVAEGNTFLCGVGDDGGKDNHAIKTFVANQPTEFQIEKGEPGNLRFTAWYSEDNQVSVTIERPNGQTEGPFMPPSGPANAQDTDLDQIRIFHRGADVEFAQSSANLRQLLIDFTGETGAYKVILTPLEINGGSRINAFLNPALYNNANTFLNNTNPGGNINSYSSCRNVISPGDYVATNEWTDINGVIRRRVGEGLPGEIWIGSSIGRTMDGRLGVDFVAPGEIAYAAYGVGSFYSAFDFNIIQNSERNYGIQTAVSAAAPITAGVIALMLEVDPSLSPAEIKSILQQTAQRDDFTGEGPNAIWGFGKLDALAAVQSVLSTVSVETSTIDKVDFKGYPNPFTNELKVTSDILKGESAIIEISSLFGQTMMVNKYSIGDIMDLSQLDAGIYFVQLKIAEHIWVKKLVKY